MKKRMPDIICGLLILLFAYTAFSKLLAFSHFRFVLSSAPLIGNYSTVLAALIPVTELFIVILLFMPRTTKAGLIAASSLLLVFTVYLVFMILTDPHLPCSCGGVIQRLSWREHIAFNVFFILIGIAGIYFHRHILNKEKQRSDIL